MEYMIDSMNSILYTPSFTIQKSDNYNDDTSSTMSTSPSLNYLALTSRTTNTNVRDGLNLGNNFLYRKKFKKIGFFVLRRHRAKRWRVGGVPCANDPATDDYGRQRTTTDGATTAPRAGPMGVVRGRGVSDNVSHAQHVHRLCRAPVSAPDLYVL